MNFITILKQAIRFGVVFLYGSTGETIVERSGHLNLGIPGIMCLGGVGGCMGAYWAYQGVYMPLLKEFGANNIPHLTAVAALIIFSAVAMAMVFGGLGGLLYGVFTITMRCNQNVTGLTLTTFGAGVLGFWGTQMGEKDILFAPIVRRAMITESLFFGKNVPEDWFSTIFLSHGVFVYLGIVIAILVAIYIKFTRQGLAMRAVGENPAAADAAGINVIAHKYVSCVVGAAISGIGGAFYLLDCTRGSLEYVIDAYRNLHMGDHFFRSFFELLIGRDYVRKMIKEGASAEEIKAMWADDVASFKEQRKPYLLYEE